MSKLDELLDDNGAIKHCCGQRGTDIEASKRLIKDLFIELMDANKFPDRSATEEEYELLISYDNLKRKVEEL